MVAGLIIEGLVVGWRCMFRIAGALVTNIYLSEQASLCGHYEVAQLLLESGALCERDTFQGERWELQTLA